MGLIASWWNPIDWIRGGLGALGGAVGAAANGLLADIFEWLSSLLLRGVIWLLEVVYQFISEQTTPDLEAAWFRDGPLAIAQRVGGMVLLMLVILTIAETVWNRDGGQLLRSLGQDAPKVMVLTLALTFMTAIGLAVADGVSNMFMALFGDNVATFTEAMARLADELALGAGVLVIVLMALVLILVLLFVALELVFRSSFVLILVPLCAVLFATEVYRPTKGMGSRCGRLLIVTIAAKPMIALCLSVGAVSLGQQAVSPDVNAAAEPTQGPRTVTQTDVDAWVRTEMAECATGGDFAGDDGQAALVLAVTGADDGLNQRCRELLVPERCCGELSWTGVAELDADADPWQPTTVSGGDGEESAAVDDIDTSGVAPTFGLMMAGLATMVLAGFSPFVLMKLISTDSGGDTGEARAAAGRSAGTARGTAGKATGAMAKKAR